jgi:hypothetical protein
MTQAVTPQTVAAENPNAGRTLSIVALVMASVGLCIPLLGLLAIPLAIVAIVRGRGVWRGLGIGGTALGVLSFFTTALVLGLLLPALAKARETARTVKSANQLSMIAEALGAYHGAFDALPASGSDLQAIFVAGGFTPSGVWTSPHGDESDSIPSYLFTTFDPANLEDHEIFIIENPAIGARRVNVLMGDFSIRQFDAKDAVSIMKRQQTTLLTPHGAPYALP